MCIARGLLVFGLRLLIYVSRFPHNCTFVSVCSLSIVRSMVLSTNDMAFVRALATCIVAQSSYFSSCKESTSDITERFFQV